MFTTQNTALSIDQIEVMPTGWNGESSFNREGALAYLGELEIQYDIDYSERQFTVRGGHFVDDQTEYTHQKLVIENIKVTDEDNVRIPLSVTEYNLIDKEIRNQIDIQ